MTVHSTAEGELPAGALSWRFKEAVFPGAAETEFSARDVVWAWPTAQASTKRVIYLTVKIVGNAGNLSGVFHSLAARA